MGGKVPQGTYLGCVEQYGCGTPRASNNFPKPKLIRSIAGFVDGGKSGPSMQWYTECRDACVAEGYEYFGFHCQGFCKCKSFMPGEGRCVPEKLSDYLPQIQC